MKPWFEKELAEADIIKFPEPEAKVIQMPNVQEYPDFITGVQDLQAKQKDGTISQESYNKLYAELIHRFMKKESFETPWFIREEIVSKSTDSTKYINAVQALLAKGGEIPFGPKGEIRMDVEPGTKLTKGLDTVIQGTINGKKDAYVAGKIHKDAVKDSDSEKWNTGNVTEGIFGAGIYTALGLSRAITVPQLQTFLSTKLKGNGKTVHGNVRKTGDKISLMVNLSQNNYNALIDPKVLKKLEKHIQSVVDYVNSEEITELDKMFQANRTIDDIKVIADGVSEEDVSKVDVYVKYDDGETRFERSVKTGDVKQFGQVSTGGAKDTGRTALSREERFDLQQDFWETWGIDISKAEQNFYDAETFITAYDHSYNEAAEQFKWLLKGTGNEDKVIQQLIKSIQFHAYRDNPNAKMINFDKKGYMVLDFAKLTGMEKELDLTADFIRTTKKDDVRARPELHITDNNGNVFLIFRLYVSKDKITNLIEKGPLLTKITKVKSNY